jgi:uncharacterized protein (UPF0276 family)
MFPAPFKNFGVGIGLRRENVDELLEKRPQDIQCLEIAPENYLHTGGKLYRQFRELQEIYPVVAHGLSLSVGSLSPLKEDFLKDLKKFLRDHRFPWMSDHLCYSSVFGRSFHDLLPLPFTDEAIRHVVSRIRRIQNDLEMPFAVENISYYAPASAGGPASSRGENEMTEWEFLAEVAEGADCSLLLDVNNIYVNSVNHGFDPMEYLKAVPFERVLHVHVAGHQEYRGFILDNHGAAVIDPVWELLREVARRARPSAVILERDHHIPPLAELAEEAKVARRIMEQPDDGGGRTGSFRSVAAVREERVFGYQL